MSVDIAEHPRGDARSSAAGIYNWMPFSFTMPRAVTVTRVDTAGPRFGTWMERIVVLTARWPRDTGLGVIAPVDHSPPPHRAQVNLAVFG